MTAHIKAKKGDFARVVLMPGDPLRAKWIAENFLKDIVLVNDVRGMLAYTGTYNNVKVSIMGHGMGIPSIGIYSYELFKFFDVDCILRIGSAGAYNNSIKLGDLLLVKDAYSDSTYAKLIGVDPINNMLQPSSGVNDLIQKIANDNSISIKAIKAHSSDVFYSNKKLEDIVRETNCDAVEMEAFALFANASILGKDSGCLLTCSDSLVTHEQMTPEERQTSFKDMVKLALEFAISYSKK
ncbi:MAG: purine-nucleoside phosphorylase [Malacoplasma sp.]